MKFRLKGASGAHTGRPFELAEDTAIGSGDHCDIRLEGLVERHARIVFDGRTLMLESAAEAWVNGEPATRRPLASGDEIRLGQHRFVLQAPGLRPPNLLSAGKRRNGLSPWLWVSIVLLAAALGIGLIFFYGTKA